MGSRSRRMRDAAASRAVPVLSGGEIALRSTGVQQHVAGERQRDPDKLDPGRGKHQWVIAVTHSVADPEPWVTEAADNERLLDAETLLFTTGVFCWKCEKPYVKGGIGPCPDHP